MSLSSSSSSPSSPATVYTISDRLSVQIVDPSDDSPAEKGSFLSGGGGGEYRSATTAAVDAVGLPKTHRTAFYFIYKRTELWYMKTGEKNKTKQYRLETHILKQFFLHLRRLE